MNPNLLLSWLKSDSSIERVRAARILKIKIPPELMDEIRKQYQKEDVPWVKEALLAVLRKHDKVNKSPGTKKKAIKKAFNENEDLRAEDIKAIQSDAVSDSIGQVLHEIEPVVGALKVVARQEISDYKSSNLKKEFDRLDELLQTFENWRRVEQSPRYTQTNIYELIYRQVSHEQLDEVDVEINVPRQLEFSTDQMLLRIIFSNAIRNAVDATLNVDPDNRQPIVISVGTSEIGLWASVLDKGSGLPASDKLTLSGSYSTKPGHRGMGLAIIDKAIDVLDGTWDLRDGSIGGAVLFFEIPRKGE